MNIQERVQVKNLIVSPLKTIVMERINWSGWRIYTTTDTFKPYSGITGALAASTFKGNRESKRLAKWRDGMVEQLGSLKAQEAYVDSMADFGTACHEAIVRIWENKGLDWKFEQQYAYDYFLMSDKMNNIPFHDGVIRQRVFEYCKSVAAIMQFIFDEVEEIYAVESMCLDDELCIATPVDIVCKLKRKGNPIVTINLKTSEQLSDSHRTQVVMEKYLWNKTYPECQASGTALLRPKNWNLKKKPTYEFEIVDESCLEGTLKRLELCKNDPESTYLSFPKDTLEFVGETKIGDAPVFKVKTLEEILREGKEVKQ